MMVRIVTPLTYKHIMYLKNTTQGVIGPLEFKRIKAHKMHVNVLFSIHVT